jgi:hypothetical protein
MPDSIIDNITNNFSIINGRYHDTLWTIYDFLFKQHQLNSKLSLNVMLDKYKSTLELISPQCLSTIIKSCKNFASFIIRNKKDQSELIEIFDKSYELIWDIELDVRNFNNSLCLFLDNLLDKELVLNDNKNSYKDFIIKISNDMIIRGNVKPVVIKPLVDRFLNLISQLNSYDNEYFIDLIISFIIFGDVYKKDKK